MFNRLKTIVMKKIYVCASIVLICTAVTFFIANANDANDIFSTNVEALALVESGGKECYNEFINDPDDSDVYCQTCQPLPGRGKDQSNCNK